MSIQLIPPERFLEVQAAMRQEAAESAPETANARVVAELGSRVPLTFQGRTYRVPPVSYRDGVRLQDLAERINQAAREGSGATMADVLALADEAVGIMGDLLRPRWLRWLPNPFRSASEQEVAVLLRFFIQLRTMSTVRHSSQSQGSAGRRRI